MVRARTNPRISPALAAFLENDRDRATLSVRRSTSSPEISRQGCGGRLELAASQQEVATAFLASIALYRSNASDGAPPIRYEYVTALPDNVQKRAEAGL